VTDLQSRLTSALDRAAKAESVSSKLSRLVKIRDLQLEKMALEQSSAQLEVQRLNEALSATKNSHDKSKNKWANRVEQLRAALEEERNRNAQLVSERDALRRSSDSSEADKLALQQKDNQIAAVMAEGQALQVKQQKLEMIIKNLRKDIAKREEERKRMETDQASHTKTITDLTTKFSELKHKYSNMKDELLSATTRRIDLEQAVEASRKTEEDSMKQLDSLRLQLQSSQDRCRKFEKQIEELNHQIAAQTEQHSDQEATLQAIQAEKDGASRREEELMQRLADLQSRAQSDRMNLESQLESSMSEVSNLRSKLLIAESRNEELISAVPQATRPLLRQIENLQSSLQSKASNFEGTERRLHQRIQNLEMEAIKRKNEMDAASQKMNDLQLEVSRLQQQLQTAQAKNDSSHETIRKMQATVDASEIQRRDLQVQTERLQEEVERVKREKDVLNKKLLDRSSSPSPAAASATPTSAITPSSTTPTHMNATGMKEIQQLYIQEKMARERLEDQLQMLRQEKGAQSETAASNGDHSRSSSSADPSSPLTSSPSPTSLPFTLSSDVGSSASSGVSSAMLELLRSTLTQREGELRAVKDANRQLEATRSSLSDELVRLTTELNSMRSHHDRVAQLEAQLGDVQKRHDAALLILGEKQEELTMKEEEVEDLRSDIQQIKLVYQAQLDALGQEVQTLKEQRGK